MIRVFIQRTSMTPDDDMAFIGDPPFYKPDADEVHISCVFTWDIPEAQRLQRAWSDYYSVVKVGGPAFDDPGGEFVPGRYLREGVTITSRGCGRKCPWCYVPRREGGIRQLEIKPGNVVQDNNLLACSPGHVESVFKMLETQNRIRFLGGLDARRFEGWHGDWIIQHQKHIHEMWFAYDSDTSGIRFALERVADKLKTVQRGKKRCYVLIGFNNETISRAEKRLQHAWDLGYLPFAQFYKGPGEQPKTQAWADLQRAWTRPAIMKAKQKVEVKTGIDYDPRQVDLTDLLEVKK